MEPKSGVRVNRDQQPEALEETSAQRFVCCIFDVPAIDLFGQRFDQGCEEGEEDQCAVAGQPDADDVERQIAEHRVC